MEFVENYNKLFPIVRNYLLKVSWKSLDYQNINEVINKSFFEYYNKYGFISYEIKSINYLCKFAYNIMRNTYSYKKRYYDKNSELNDFYYNNITDKNNDLLDNIILNERFDILYNSIKCLGVNEQNIIILYFFYDYNLKEISLFLNLNYYYVLKHKKNALFSLRNILNNIDYNFFD